MQITAEIQGLDPVPSQPWDGGQHGPTWFVQGRFKDGSLFSRGAKSVENANKLHATLSALTGQEAQYEVEPNGEFKGQKKFKLQSWPGKEERSFGGGGGGAKRDYVPRYRDTPQGARDEQLSIHRSVALQQAVAFFKDRPSIVVDDVLKYADGLYGWLIKELPPVAQAPGPTAFQEYGDEIERAVKSQDEARLKQLHDLIVKSLDKGSVTVDEASRLDDQLSAAASAIKHSKWYADQQAKASAREPLHPDSRINKTLEEAGEVF